MKHWTIPYLLQEMLKESMADGILVSRNEPSRSLRFEFVKHGHKPQQYNMAETAYGAPIRHDFDDMDTRSALLHYAAHARRSWPQFRDYESFNKEYVNSYAYVNPNPFFREEDIRRAVRPQGKTTIESAVDISTGKECPVRELPRIEAPKDKQQGS